MRSAAIWLVLSTGSGLFAVGACGSSDREGGFDDADSGSSSGGAIVPTDGGIGKTDSGGPGFTGDPKTCEQAAQAASYVGCDYWPTITANPVQAVFDFAVVVSNGGDATAHVTVTGPKGTNQAIDVAPNSLGTIYLPWVDALKGPATTTSLATSSLQTGAAFHLVSDSPVVVYQFSPLEFEAKGGPSAKDWDECVPASGESRCYSYSNDASLLLPSTAMTGTYRVMGIYGFSAHPRNIFGELDTSKPLQSVNGSFVAITGTQDGTTVEVKVGANGKILGGSGIDATANNGTLSFTLNAGDVAQLITGVGKDFDPSGSLVRASAPVQVITGNPCIYMPEDQQACDHIEETVFPAETLGSDYVVLRPPAPKGNVIGQVVRLYGNVDGTTLTYLPSKPSKCPATLSAGEVVDCGVVDQDFQVQGDHEFGVGTFMLGGVLADPDFDPNQGERPQGDPSQSFVVTVPQYRDHYVFLAPNDYVTSYVNIAAPAGTSITLDGVDKSSELTAVTGTDFFAARIALSKTSDGSHVLDSSKPVGLQVLGYGQNTSYQYPGGLNLGKIAPAPPR